MIVDSWHLRSSIDFDGYDDVEEEEKEEEQEQEEQEIEVEEEEEEEDDDEKDDNDDDNHDKEEAYSHRWWISMKEIKQNILFAHQIFYKWLLGY